MEETPNELDWVNARANCESETVFEELSDAVEEDVKLYNSRFNPQIAQAPVFQKRKEFPVFSVYRRTLAGSVSVTFSRKLDLIEVADECGVQSLSAIPFFSDNGRCKFQVGGEEIEQWQLRRKALEAIFFKPMPR